jgi:hypothetical protein
VPTFEVTESHGWYEAACTEHGVTITARRLADVEATARRTAARALGADVPVEIVVTRKQAGILARLADLAGFFGGSGREGHS